MEKFKLAGLEMKYFIPITIILIIAIALGKLPPGMLGAFPLMMIIGAVLDYIGNKTPFVKDYLGGGPIVIIFISAALLYFNILPAKEIKIITDFMISQRFLDFYIAALIVGSILGMNRKLLIKASVSYLPVILGGVLVSLLLTGVVGAIIGTAIVGHLAGFYIVEASITAGLCMANMGGTGDVAVMSACHRMELMPFSQISSRIGGAFMLLLTSLLINLL